MEGDEKGRETMSKRQTCLVPVWSFDANGDSLEITHYVFPGGASMSPEKYESFSQEWAVEQRLNRELKRKEQSE